MSDTIQLIIDIPKGDYEAICANREDAIIAHDTCRRIANNGISLDNIKTEIANLPTHMFEVYELKSRVLHILDSIGEETEKV